jgi:hypothetical protein
MIIGASGRSYAPLPIDNTAGFPQQFPLVLSGVSYQFQFYVNVAEAALGDPDQPMVLPDPLRHLVVRVDGPDASGNPQTIFLRKVTPSLEYNAGGVWLTFPTQIVSPRNLNGVGSFGTNVVGGVALQ